MMNRVTARAWMYLAVAVLLILSAAPISVYADGTCTTSMNMQPQHASMTSTGGIVNQFVALINSKLTDMMKNLYQEFIDDPGYQRAYWAAVLFSFTVYGIMIMFNMASTKPLDVFMRIVKLSILSMFLNPALGWDFFFNYAVAFFWGTMNQLLAIFNSIALGSPITNSPVGQISTAPLAALNATLQIIFSVKFFVMFIATIFTSIMGLAYAILIAFAVINIMRSIVGAVATYFKCMIALTFLLGLAPIFIPLVLFAETKKIFQGWLNQVLSFTLQPIMLFAFISFFMVMIGTTLMRIMGYRDFCWVASDIVQGGPQAAREWAPMTPNAAGVADVMKGTWENWITFFTPPVDTMDVVMLLVLSDLAWRYSKYVSEISRDFTGGVLDMTVTGGALRNVGSSKLVQDKTEEVLNAQASAAQNAFDGNTGGGRAEAFSNLMNKRANFANLSQLVSGGNGGAGGANMPPPAQPAQPSAPAGATPPAPPSIPRPNTVNPPPAPAGKSGSPSGATPPNSPKNPKTDKGKKDS